MLASEDVQIGMPPMPVEMDLFGRLLKHVQGHSGGVLHPPGR